MRLRHKFCVYGGRTCHTHVYREGTVDSMYPIYVPEPVEWSWDPEPMPSAEFTVTKVYIGPAAPYPESDC